MIYTDYEKAAKRHLLTCFQLKEILREKYQRKETLSSSEAMEPPLSGLESEQKQALLSNLYYLSGYVIECIYNYAIYKHIGFTGQVNRLNPNSTPYRVSCHSRSGARFVIRRPAHQLSGNMHFFQTVIQIQGASMIPLIGYPIYPPRPCYRLFDNWNANVRYSIDRSLNLDYSNTYDFLSLADEIYEGVLRYL
ncbi:hypothetical protein QUF72_21805 [Desulfobacterales bacterium HSG2]|nr:hypothetical protein [Desulfobacterales bacterium HSG2]